MGWLRRVLGRRPRVCLLTAYDASYEPIAKLSSPGMHRLATVQGYDFKPVCVMECDRPGGWLKIAPILDCLNSGYDWVLWLDADVIVRRLDQDVRQCATRGGDLFMVWHDPPPRPNGDGPHFNTGVMLIRCSAWSRKFFNEVWRIGPLPYRWHDQAALHHALGYHAVIKMGPDRENPLRRRVSRLPPQWNSIPNVCGVEDPILEHFAGLPTIEARVENMRQSSALFSGFEQTLHDNP